MKDIPLPKGTVAHAYQGKELFFELYRYLSGQDVVNGKLGYTDFDGSTELGGKPPLRNLDHEFSVGFGTPATKCAFGTSPTGSSRDCYDYTNTEGYTKAAGSHLTNDGERISSALTWDPNIIRLAGSQERDRYISPYESGDWSCSGTYSINLMFVTSKQEDDSNGEIIKEVTDQGLKGWGLDNNSSFTNMIAALHANDIAGGQADGVPTVKGDQRLRSYFLSTSSSIGAGGGDKGKVNGYADAGGTGRAIAALDDPRALFFALQKAFGEIKAISSSFVAVTVPVNTDNRVNSLPNLFVALFQVDKDGNPRWPGNIKKLDIVTQVDGVPGVQVQDALGKDAFNATTGRINRKALTLWTVPTAPDIPTVDDVKKDTFPGSDGSAVMSGGAGHKTPGFLSGTGPIGLKNSEAGARQIFIDPATVTGTRAVGNDLVGVDASDEIGAMREDPEIQKLLGVRQPGLPDQTCGTDATYCDVFIASVLSTAGVSTTGLSLEQKAQVATQVFLKWVRGFDVFTAGKGAQPRPWLMGDVLHSRPLAVNYGARPPGGSGYGIDNQDVRLFFGANDGLMRMVRNTDSVTTKPAPVPTQQGPRYGEEVWAFMPRELLSHVPRLAMAGVVELNRPYGVDGEPALLTIDNNDDGIINNTGATCTKSTEGEAYCDRAWLYFGLRRGGKSYYAIDVSDPDATTPKLLWKIDDSPLGDFTELGLTFSTPRVGWVKFENVSGLNKFPFPDGGTNVPVPVVIFGGGYNGHGVLGGDHHQSGVGGPTKDTILDTPFTGADTDEGNAIFIVHARTGQLIWKVTGGAGTDSATHRFHASMEHGIAAPVSPMDSDGDGILDRLYVADTGGRVWRVDIPEFVPGVSTGAHRASTWKATVLADLRPVDLAKAPNDDLRFFHAATLVRRARDGIGVYDAIAVGSGDREHPQSETNKDNWFFLLKDRVINSGDAVKDALVPSELLDITNKCFAGSGTTCVSDTASTGNNLANGWRLALEATGEKNLSPPFIGGNGIIFTTYLPNGTTRDDDPCSPLGASRLYQVALEDGAPLRFLHDVDLKSDFVKAHRWIDLYSGIDGGVVAITPDYWMTSTGKSGKNPPQKPIQFYWRESGVDEVK